MKVFFGVFLCVGLCEYCGSIEPEPGPRLEQQLRDELNRIIQAALDQARAPLRIPLADVQLQSEQLMFARVKVQTYEQLVQACTQVRAVTPHVQELLEQRQADLEQAQWQLMRMLGGIRLGRTLLAQAGRNQARLRRAQERIERALAALAQTDPEQTLLMLRPLLVVLRQPVETQLERQANNLLMQVVQERVDLEVQRQRERAPDAIPPDVQERFARLELERTEQALERPDTMGWQSLLQYAQEQLWRWVLREMMAREQRRAPEREPERRGELGDFEAEPEEPERRDFVEELEELAERMEP